MIEQAKRVLSSKEIDNAVVAGRESARIGDGAAASFFTTANLMGLRVAQLNGLVFSRSNFIFHYSNGSLILESPFALSSYGANTARGSLDHWLNEIPAEGQYIVALGAWYNPDLRNSLAMERNNMYVCVFWFATIVALVDPLLDEGESEDVITHAFDTGMNIAHLQHIGSILDDSGYMTAAATSQAGDVSPLNAASDDSLLSPIRRARWLANESGFSTIVKEDYAAFEQGAHQDCSCSGARLDKATLKQCIQTLLIGLYSVPPPWYLEILACSGLIRLHYDRDLWPLGPRWVEVSERHPELVMLAEEIGHWYAMFFIR